VLRYDVGNPRFEKS